MKIKFIDIQNFRKLKACRIDISEKETIFVGANNSGKTTAMDALILFLKSKSKFTTHDFTLSDWPKVNEIGKFWVSNKKEDINLSIKDWEEFLPTLDVWLEVNKNELHYVSHLM